MVTPRPAFDAAPDRLRSESRDCFSDLPDRRGENLAIFTTIFVRPALELTSPVRRLAGAIATTGSRIVSRRAH
jgi:hypothetical protein